MIIVACDLFILDSEGLLKTKEKNQKLYTRAQRHQEKKEKIQRHNRKLGDLVEKKTIDLRSHYERLANLRRSHILELTSVIFPIEEVKTSVRYGESFDSRNRSGSKDQVFFKYVSTSFIGFILGSLAFLVMKLKSYLLQQTVHAAQNWGGSQGEGRWPSKKWGACLLTDPSLFLVTSHHGQALDAKFSLRL